MPQFSLNTSTSTRASTSARIKNCSGWLCHVRYVASTARRSPADIKCKDPLNPTTDSDRVSRVLSSAALGRSESPTPSTSHPRSRHRTGTAVADAHLPRPWPTSKSSSSTTSTTTIPVAKTYYLCFHCGDTEMLGILEKVACKDLTLSVADDASTEVQSPINYSFSVGYQAAADGADADAGDSKSAERRQAVGPHQRVVGQAWPCRKRRDQTDDNL
jgi:hypothetical protein